MPVDPHPWMGASITPHRIEASPTIDSSAPTGSNRGADGSLESGTKNQPPTSASATIGRLTKKTEPQ